MLLERLGAPYGSTVKAVAVLAGAYVLRRLLRRKPRVVITGGCGNLGTKLATRLVESGKWEVVLLEHPNFLRPAPSGASVVAGDLIDGAGSWTRAMRGADSVIHFSAVNPYPNATWHDSAGSMSHTFNVFLAAQRHGVRRVVFASSNHVMGGYKDRTEAAGAGELLPTSPPRCGTLLNNPEDREKSGDAVPYAAAKLAGEQLCRALAAAGGKTSFAVLRIGWCQPGANLPSTLNPAGCPPEFQTQTEAGTAGGGGGAGGGAAAESVDEAWFKNMWLSNGDFLAYFSAALTARVPSGAPLLVNAMSRNRGMRWSVKETEAALGVAAQDDSRRAG